MCLYRKKTSIYEIMPLSPLIIVTWWYLIRVFQWSYTDHYIQWKPVELKMFHSYFLGFSNDGWKERKKHRFEGCRHCHIISVLQLHLMKVFIIMNAAISISYIIVHFSQNAFNYAWEFQWTPQNIKMFSCT